MAGAATRNPPGGPSSLGGGPSGAPGPATQPVLASAGPPGHHRHRPSLAPGLFIAAAGFLIVGFAYSILSYEAFQGVTEKLTKASTISFAAGFIAVAVGLVVLAVMRARE